MNKLLKRVSVFLCGVLCIGVCSTIESNAAITKSNLTTLSEDQVQEFDKYIELTKDGEFILNKDENLTEEDEGVIESYLTMANEQVTELKSNSRIIVNVKSKTVKVQKLPSQIKLKSIDNSKYVDYTVRWNGVRVYLHHNCITDMKNYVNTSIAAGGTYGAAVAYFFGDLAGLTGGASAIIGGLSTTAAIYLYEKVIANDKGNGVYIDFPWSLIQSPSLGIVLTKIQSA